MMPAKFSTLDVVAFMWTAHSKLDMRQHGGNSWNFSELLTIRSNLYLPYTLNTHASPGAFEFLRCAVAWKCLPSFKGSRHPAVPKRVHLVVSKREQAINQRRLQHCRKSHLWPSAVCKVNLYAWCRGKTAAFPGSVPDWFAYACLSWHSIGKSLAIINEQNSKEVVMAADSPLNLLKIDMGQRVNVVATPKIDRGFAAKNALWKALKLSDLTVLEFTRDCTAFMKNWVKKITARSPLNFKLMRGLPSPDPVCALIPELDERRLTDALKVVTEHRWITGADADWAMQSYKHVCSLASTEAALTNFDRSRHRLDALWSCICGSKQELLNFAKVTLFRTEMRLSSRDFLLTRAVLLKIKTNILWSSNK